MGKFINPFTDVGFKRIFGQQKEENECADDFERWIYVLKHMETLERMPFRARKSVFERLEEVVTISRMTKAEREMYDESVKILRDRLSELAYAQEEGLAKGLEQGREEGRKAERLSIAYNMKALGLPAETIADATGLSPEEIGRL